MKIHPAGKSRLVMALAAIGVTAVALGAGAPMAYAANGNIDPDATGSLSLFKQATGGTVTGSPTGATAADGTPLAGATFTLQPITNVDLGTTAGWELVDGLTVPATACDTPSFALVGGTDAVLGPVTPEATKTTTLPNGMAEFTNLDVGAYLVCETVTPAGVVGKSAPFVATIPFYDETSGSWLYDVTAYPKNVVSGQATKEILVEDAVQTPGQLTYRVAQEVPQLQNGQSFAYFIVEDTLDDALTMPGLSAGVSVTLDGATLAESTHYVLSRDGSSIRVGFTSVGLTALAEAQGETVAVDFTVDVSNPAPAGMITNTANVYLKTQEGPTPTEPPTDPTGPVDPPTPSETVKSYTGDYTFTKVDSGDGSKALSGAQFDVFPALEPFATVCTIEIPDGAASIGTYTSDENGDVNIEGLFIDTKTSVDGPDPDNDERCYVLVEKVAPVGYTLPQGDAAVKAIRVGSGVTAGADVQNSASSMPNLPLTGGTGQMLLLFGGVGALVAAAGVILSSRRRKGAKTEA